MTFCTLCCVHCGAIKWPLESHDGACPASDIIFSAGPSWKEIKIVVHKCYNELQHFTWSWGNYLGPVEEKRVRKNKKSWIKAVTPERPSGKGRNAKRGKEKGNHNRGKKINTTMERRSEKWSLNGTRHEPGDKHQHTHATTWHMHQNYTSLVRFKCWSRKNKQSNGSLWALQLFFRNSAKENSPKVPFSGSSGAFHHIPWPSSAEWSLSSGNGIVNVHMSVFPRTSWANCVSWWKSRDAI